MDLAQRGFAVVNYTYRLAPEFKFPSSLEDTNLVFTWVLQHAPEYGFDIKHVFAVGDSAGAHNLGLYTSICTNREYASKYPFQVPEGFVPTAVALNCGKYEISHDGVFSDEQTKLLMEDLLPEQGSPKEHELINVAEHVTKDYPPVFLMTSTGDFLKDYAIPMAAKLSSCDVPFMYRLYGDCENKLGHVFHCDVRSADARVQIKRRKKAHSRKQFRTCRKTQRPYSRIRRQRPRICRLYGSRRRIPMSACFLIQV